MSDQQNQQILGAALRWRRRSAKLTQEKLAERAEVDVSYVSGIERGKRNPSLTILIRLAHACGISTGELLADLQ